jgi:hypothetical protein
MKLGILFISILLIGSAAHSASTTDEEFVLSAAKRADAQIVWQSKSVINGNFTCRGRKEFAILGTSAKQIVIGVFAQNIAKPIEIMRFSGVVRDPATATISIESLDFKTQDSNDDDSIPKSVTPSKTCVGLNMTDDRIDSAHIYWNRKSRRFESWSR